MLIAWWILFFSQLVQIQVQALKLTDANIERYIGSLKPTERKALLDWYQSLKASNLKRNRRTNKLRIEKKQLFDPSGILVSFSDACVIFTGGTEIFNFSSIEVAPFIISTSPESASQLANVSNRLVKTFAKTVRQQLIIHGDDILSTKRDQKPRFELYPQAVVVMNTKLPYMADKVPPVLNVFEAFWATRRAMMYMLSYDLKKSKAVVGHCSCPYCISRGPFHLMATSSEYFRWDVRFKWNVGNAGEVMNKVRVSETLNGRRLRWYLKYVVPIVNLKIGGTWSESSPYSDNGKSLDGQKRLEIAAIRVLFPHLNQTTAGGRHDFTKTCVISGSSALQCSAQELHAPFYSHFFFRLTFDYGKLRDDDIAFISSEKVKDANDINAVDVFVKVFDVHVWLVLFLSLVATATMCFVAGVVVKEVQEVHGTTRPVVPELKAIITAVIYLLAGFLGQETKCPSEGTGSIHHVRFLILPWLVLHSLLAIWYTTFWQLSFSFPFPYELETQSWKGFENYSMYILEPEMREFGSESSNLYFITHQNWTKLLDTLQTALAEAYPSSNEFNENPVRDYFPNPWHTAMHEKSQILRHFSGNEVIDLTASPILTWFKETQELADLCLSQSFGHNEKPTECTKVKDAIWKMIYGHSFIGISQLEWHVGSSYQNSIKNARQEGAQIMAKLNEWKIATSGADIWDEQLMSNGSYCYVRQFRDWYSATTLRMKYVLYWMTRKSVAVFVVTKTEFPWYWTLFKKMMRKNKSLKFAHTGPLRLRDVNGLRENAFQSQVQVLGPTVLCLPELRYMLRRFRTLTHSGILGHYAKWDMILHPPVRTTKEDFAGESATGASALRMEDAIIFYTLRICGIILGVSLSAFFAEVCHVNGRKMTGFVIRSAVFLRSFLRGILE